jgi:hypothetical protein
MTVQAVFTRHSMSLPDLDTLTMGESDTDSDAPEWTQSSSVSSSFTVGPELEDWVIKSNAMPPQTSSLRMQLWFRTVCHQLDSLFKHIPFLVL